MELGRIFFIEENKDSSSDNKEGYFLILNFGTSLFNPSLVWRLLVVYSQICMVLIVCGWSAVQSRLLAMTGANYYGIWTARSSLARSFVWLAKVKPALFSGLMSGMADDECDGGTETLIRPKVSDNFCLRPFCTSCSTDLTTKIVLPNL